MTAVLENQARLLEWQQCQQMEPKLKIFCLKMLLETCSNVQSLSSKKSLSCSFSLFSSFSLGLSLCFIFRNRDYRLQWGKIKLYTFSKSTHSHFFSLNKDLFWENCNDTTDNKCTTAVSVSKISPPANYTRASSGPAPSCIPKMSAAELNCHIKMSRCF